MFAAAFHPAMRFVGPARREIGIRTIFNSLGPLTNPAGAKYQLLGVGDASLVTKVAQVLARLGSGRVLVVHGEDGLDEVTLSGATLIQEVKGSDVKSYRLTPEEAGFTRVPLQAVKTGTVQENAARLRAVLAGTKGPDRDYSLINAAVALTAANRAADVKEGVALASHSIDSGSAGRVLDAFIAASQEDEA
jgi:anthranilate phosphoribosyltransferase